MVLSSTTNTGILADITLEAATSLLQNPSCLEAAEQQHVIDKDTPSSSLLLPVDYTTLDSSLKKICDREFQAAIALYSLSWIQQSRNGCLYKTHRLNPAALDECTSEALKASNVIHDAIDEESPAYQHMLDIFSKTYDNQLADRVHELPNGINSYLAGIYSRHAGNEQSSIHNQIQHLKLMRKNQKNETPERKGMKQTSNKDIHIWSSKRDS